MFNYNKVIVIGCPGAGKSTFSRKLHIATKIDLYHLDSIYWNSDCTHISREELIEKQKEILKNNRYIIDGNFKSTLELRIKEADVVFLFDLPTQICIEGARKRKGNRPEMPCQLPSNDELIDFIKNFNKDVMPKIQLLINKYNKNVIVFHSHKEADDYIKHISTEYWDAYDRNMKLIPNLTLERGSVPKGVYHLVCDIAVKHIDGTYLIMQRDRKKHLGGMWELTAGGSALKGETPLECAIRELKEETGIEADTLTQIGSLIYDEHNSIYFEYLCITDINKDRITLQVDETINYKWITVDEFRSIPKYELATTRMQCFIEELR